MVARMVVSATAPHFRIRDALTSPEKIACVRSNVPCRRRGAERASTAPPDRVPPNDSDRGDVDERAFVHHLTSII